MGTVDVVFGRVIGIHIKDEILTADGRIDVLKIRPIARLGYHDYTSIESMFQMIIPGQDRKRLQGMDGSARF
jgi:flavin reductase (DIM6/NTAB) family NADH-FMN oxidoreductase RutF